MYGSFSIVSIVWVSQYRKMYGSVSIGKYMGQSVWENVWVSQYGKMYGSVSMGKCMGRSV